VGELVGFAVGRSDRDGRGDGWILGAGVVGVALGAGVGLS
jgi:hypothetical protein